MIDVYQTHQPGLESPASDIVMVSPSDTDMLKQATRAIAVGHEGFVQVTTIAGSTGRIYIVPGAPFPIRVLKIWASGTTATDIVALA